MEVKMKRYILFISLVLFMATGCSAYISSQETGYYPDTSGQYGGDPQQYGQQQQQYGADMDMESMYNYLAPYGNWVDMQPYGYVWTPRNMGYQWRPYSNGHWVMTEYGWTWIAYEPWGSIPFHYGRWGYDDYMGWYWVPGTTWGPAWVSWRGNDQYTGWAPLQPGIEIQVGMDFGSLSINIPLRSWNFLQTSHFMDSDVNRYSLPYERNNTIFNYTNDRNNYAFRNDRIYNGGIPVDTVQRATRRNVQQYRIQDARRPGAARLAGKDLQIYRPNLRVKAGAKPRVFLNQDVARKELAPVKIFDPKQQESLNAQETAVRRRQANEKALLQKTQAEDLKVLQRNRDLQLAKVRDNTEKLKIKQDNQNRIAELQKQQQNEKLQLQERHKQDAEVVKKVTLEKKQARLKKQQATTVKKKKGGKN
jgi:hypothetical protein